MTAAQWLEGLAPATPDERFMLEALKEAVKAYNEQEVPIGAVIVDEHGSVVARGYNQVELLRDATAHAEMLAMTAAAGARDNWRLVGCTLFCTLEPCCMCAGAAILSRLDSIVWAAPDRRHGANGSIVDLFALRHPIHNVKVRQGPYGAVAAALLQQFFKERRAEG